MESIAKYTDIQIRLTKYLALLYALVLPIHFKSSIKILVVLLFFSLIALYTDRVYIKENFKRKIKGYTFPLIYLILSVIGIFYSENKTEAIRIVTDKSLFVAFAFIIALALSSIISIRQVVLAFVLGVTLACIICLTYAIYRDVTEGAYWAYYHLVFSDIIDSHPIYLGYFLNFASAAVLFYVFIKPNSPTSVRVKAGAIVLIAFYLFIHFLLAGRVPVLAIFFSLTIWFIFLGKNKMRFALSMLIVIVIGGFSLFFLKNKSVFIDRFVDAIKFSDRIEDTKYGGHLERLALWKAGIGANPNFLFGVGTGDSQAYLNEYYKKNNYDESFIKEQYNAHSQYVQQYLIHGVTGFVVFFLMASVPVFTAVRRRDFLTFMFFTPFLIYSLTEVFLVRYQGFAFYFFFYALLLLKDKSK